MIDRPKDPPSLWTVAPDPDEAFDAANPGVFAAFVRAAEEDVGLGLAEHLVVGVAAGERVRAIGDAPDDLSERERDHQEVDAARADREQSEHRRKCSAQKYPHDDDQPEIPTESEVHFRREHGR